MAPKPVDLPPPPPPISVPSVEQYQMDGEMDLPPPPPPIRTTSLGQRPMVMRPVDAPPPPPIRTTSLGQYQMSGIPAKPQRGISRDFDDLIDGFADDEDEDDDDDDEIIRCKVEAKRPYSVSPTITVTGIRDRFNALLIGYDTHMDERRANKASLYGWSSPKTPSSSGVAKFDFDLDYVSILPQGGIPLSYCALIFVPPVVPKFDTQSVFAKPAMSLARFIASEEHLVKALKKKNKRVTSCCFVAYPMVAKR
ncbi:hypothetical protein TpMuguga_03g00803 [Theileria parva strain Muguga]|uniref:uncharacterized protein n=1 Tax=Theileria parva strain Muguga TaxID=333668 RepID=UPI001C61A647|nr:uncharacterized protein TpMuguga_03g00803 [Theileria parva strain Muguga]KAF5153548.1 hypothetical protein TpMuguga_03g00803 [Theileria parva strain Muguga]